jgi:iron(III) transport system ATP-binding protein
MDEPFSNLDADLKASIRLELRSILKKTGITCIMVTHDRNDVDSICDRSITMGSGNRISSKGKVLKNNTI